MRRPASGLAMLLGVALALPAVTRLPAQGADSAQAPGHAMIREAELRADLFFLAGDGLRGRFAGGPDELRAATWIASQAAKAGLEPAGEDGTWYQWFPVRRTRVASASRVTLDGRPLALWDEVLINRPTIATLAGPIMWLDAAAAAAPDSARIRGRIVATRLTPPTNNRAFTQFLGAWRVTNLALRQQSARLLNAGAAAVVFVGDTIAESAFDVTASWAAAGSDALADAPARPIEPTPPVLWITADAAGDLAGGTHQLSLATFVESFEVPSVNVVGRVPGTDATVASEYVLFSSHHDHDGVRYTRRGDSISNGADDNASVAVASLAIARAWAAKPARRPALFVWHGAEERGLLGSRWYVEHPTVPREHIVAVLNADMIGRNHPDSAALLGVQPPHRNSSALADMAIAANAAVTHFAVDSLWDRPMHPEGWYFRSDHLPYARAGIPALMYSTLLHEDYHTPFDNPERIDVTKLRRMTQWMYETGWRVAQAAVRLRVDPGARLER